MSEEMLKDKYILLLHKKLSGQISLSETSKLRKWLEEDEANVQVQKEIEEIWILSKEYEPTPKTDLTSAKDAFFEAIQKEKSHPEIYQLNTEKRTRPLVYRLMSVAAALIILIAAYFIIFEKSGNIPEFLDQKQLIALDAIENDIQRELSDGSELFLKKGSYLRLDDNFGSANRTVYLDGEMFIHVASNAGLPFIIKMAQNEIKVLGTAFYVKSDKSDLVELKVHEGKVEFSSVEKTLTVVQGQSINFDKSKKAFIEKDDQNPIVKNWRTSYLAFENVPLYTVFNKLAIFYGVEFEIQCEEIDNMKGFTSLIQNNDNPKLSTFLKTLQKVYDISIDKKGAESYLVHGAACN